MNQSYWTGRLVTNLSDDGQRLKCENQLFITTINILWPRNIQPITDQHLCIYIYSYTCAYMSPEFNMYRRECDWMFFVEKFI